MPSDLAKLPPLLPAPARVRVGAGAFSVADGTLIALSPSATDADVATAGVLRDAVARRCGRRPSVECHSRLDDLGPRIDLHREGDRGEAYRLTVARDRIAVDASGPAGLRYAVETLSQLVSDAGRIPACAIDDAPELALRGVMLDVSRGKVPTVETLRALVDLCVRLKLNALMLYVEHTFRFRRHPKIGADASPLDAETLRELDAYAARHHVQLIPSLQSLGHMDHVLELPEYRGLAETKRGWTLSPAEEGSYDLLEDLYDEVLPAFRSRLFNANCDESFDLEQGKSAARARELGPGGVFLEHVRRVRALARRHGKRTMIWADMVHAHPERITELPSDVLLLDWWYEAECDYDRVARFTNSGREFVACPGTSTWNSLFPRVDNSLANIRGWAGAARRHGARGLLLTDWGDFGHYNLQGNSWLAYAAAAQQAWSGDAPERGFDRAFGSVLFGDPSGTTAGLYRELGAIHDAGFRVFNGSALQFLYFDDFDRGFFVEGVEPEVLSRSLERLEAVRAKIEEAGDRFTSERLTHEELLLAADASLLAARKGLAGERYLAWRRGGRVVARERRRLARDLAQLATEQRALGKTLQRLWLARSRPSNFEITARRLERSIRSMRRAARALEKNRPPAPPPEHPGFDVDSVFAAIWDSVRSAA